MAELRNQVIDIVENCGDDVPGYLKEHRQAKFKPVSVLPQLKPEELAKARKGQNLPSAEAPAAQTQENSEATSTAAASQQAS